MAIDRPQVIPAGGAVEFGDIVGLGHESIRLQTSPAYPALRFLRRCSPREGGMMIFAKIPVNHEDHHPLHTPCLMQVKIRSSKPLETAARHRRVTESVNE
jgi:hypothetical protein